MLEEQGRKMEQLSITQVQKQYEGQNEKVPVEIGGENHLIFPTFQKKLEDSEIWAKLNLSKFEVDMESQVFVWPTFDFLNLKSVSF